jgi:uncharacterized membrane protein
MMDLHSANGIPRLAARLAPVLFALFQPLPAFAQQSPQWDWPGPWHMWSGGWGLWWIFPLLFMLFMIIMCAAMFFYWHRSGGGHHHFGPWQMMDRGRSWGDPNYSALQILNERFARGEIEKPEYEEKLAAITRAR